MKKRKGWIVCVLLSLLLALAMGGGILTAMASEMASEGEEDADFVEYRGSALTLGDATTNNVTSIIGADGEEAELKFHTSPWKTSSPGLLLTDINDEMRTDGMAPYTALVITFDETDTNTYPVLKMRIGAQNWSNGDGEKLLFFGTQTVLSESTAVYKESFGGYGGFEKTFTLDATQFADANGKVSSVTIMKTLAPDGNGLFFDYIRFEKVPEYAEYRGSALTLGDKDTNGVTSIIGADGEEAGLNFHSVWKTLSPGALLTDINDEMRTDGIAPYTALVIKFAETDTNTYPVLKMRMGAQHWIGSTPGSEDEVLLFFGTQTVLSEATAVDKVNFQFVGGSSKKEFTLDATQFADANGKVSSITIMKTVAPDNNGLFFDYIRFEKASEIEENVSQKLQAGNLILSASKSPATKASGTGKVLESDERIHWLDMESHPNYPPYGYVDAPAKSDYTTVKLGMDKEGDNIKCKNVLQAIAIPHLKAENYARFELTYLFTDWSFGAHEFYIYGSGTTQFLDADGKPTGYAVKSDNKGPESKHTVTVNDVNSLADTNGYIDVIYILYGGEKSNIGFYAGSQLWLNEVNFLIEDDVPKPNVSEEYTTKDVTELLPVGNGATLKMTSSGITEGEGYGACKRVISAQTQAADVIDMNVTVTYTDNFSFYFILQATEGKDFTDSGIVFWFASNNVLIGNGVKGDYAQKFAVDYPLGAFASGAKTKISLRTIPYYEDGLRGGLWIALYVNDGEEPILEKFVADTDTTLGGYTTIVTQDLGKDYEVKLESAGTATAAADVMKVKIASASGKTEFTKPRASLTLSHFATEGEQVSDVVVDGDATYNAETKVLTFDKNGKVKVYYTVTNAFGTFKSNELELTYDDGTTPSENNGTGNETNPNKGCSCGSALGTISTVAASVAVLAFAAVALVARKRKQNRSEE